MSRLHRTAEKHNDGVISHITEIPKQCHHPLMMISWLFFIFSFGMLFLVVALYAGVFEKIRETLVRMAVFMLLILGSTLNLLTVGLHEALIWVFPWLSILFLLTIFSVVKWLEVRLPPVSGFADGHLVSAQDIISEALMLRVILCLFGVTALAKLFGL